MRTMTPHNNNMLLLRPPPRWSCMTMMRILFLTSFMLLMMISSNTAAALGEDEGETMTKSNNNEGREVIEQYLYHNDPSAKPVIEFVATRKSDFQIATDKLRVIEFYSPYCGHCRLFRPKYVSLARNFFKKHPEQNNNNNANVAFYAVSCDAHPDLCDKYNVEGYPSIYTMKQGHNSELELLTPGKLTIETLEEAFGILLSTDEDGGSGGVEQDAATAADIGDDSGGAVVRKSRALEEVEEEEENTIDGAEAEDAAADVNEEEQVLDDDEKNNHQRRRHGGVVDDDEEEKENIKRDNIQTEEEEEYDSEKRSKPAKYSNKAAAAPAADDDESGFEQKLAKVASLPAPARPVQPKAGANLARQRRGDIMTERTKQGVKKVFLKHKGGGGGGGFFSNNMRRHAQPKPGLRPDDKPAPRGETDTMKAHRHDTQEFEERKGAILAHIERNQGRKVRQQVEQRWAEIMQAQGEKKRAPFKKVVAKPRLAERMPIVKRFVPKMGEEESLMLDTSLSFLHGLKMGVFNVKEKGPLSRRKKQALTDWLDLMSIALPQEWGLQTAIDDLSDNIDLISQSQKDLERILFRHKLHRVTWSDSCGPKNNMKGTGGFTCGFWKLIHTMSVGIAEHRGGQTLIDGGIVSRQTRTFTPLEAATTLRHYMDHFYICEECSRNFIADFDNCEHRLCDRLADDADTASHADWKELGSWLWELHNDVSLRVLRKRKDEEETERRGRRFGFGGGKDSTDDEIAALWPSIDTCLKCFQEDGSWNEDAVFLYLEHAYWPGATPDSKTHRLLEFDSEIDPEGSGLFMVLLICLFALVVAMRQTLSVHGLQQTVIMAKRMAPKGAVAAEKRSV